MLLARTLLVTGRLSEPHQENSQRGVNARWPIVDTRIIARAIPSMTLSEPGGNDMSTIPVWG